MGDSQVLSERAVELRPRIRLATKANPFPGYGESLTGAPGHQGRAVIRIVLCPAALFALYTCRESV